MNYMLPDKSDILSRINRAILRGSNLKDRISRRLSRRLLGQKSTKFGQDSLP